MNNHIKPCPFCGAQATLSYMVNSGIKVPPFTVQCSNIYCAVWPFVSAETENEAIAAWNTRTLEEKDNV